MLSRCNARGWYLGPGHQLVAVEVAQLETGYQQSAQTTVQVGLPDVAPPDGLGQVLIFRAALHIGAGQHGLGRCLGSILGHIVPLGQEVADGPAVAGDEPLEAPLIAQYLLLVAVLGAAGLSVNPLIGTHHLSHPPLLHQRLEGWQIGLPEVALGQRLNVEGMPIPLWTAVHGKVLGTGQQLAVLADAQVLTVIAHSLQAAHHSQPHPARQVRVFAVGLLSPPPARVAEDVDVGSPERQALIALDVASRLGLLGLGPSLVADSRVHPVQQGIVPRGSHRHRDGEHGGNAVAPYSVQGLVPPLERRDAQSRNSRRCVHHQQGFLFQGQSA